MNECPTCHRPFGAAQRTCFACTRPILRNHKWHIVGCYIRHDDCQNPTIRVLVRTPQPSQPMLDEPQEIDPRETEESHPLDRPE